MTQTKTVELPVITREVADAIESFRESRYTNELILRYSAYKDATTDRARTLRKFVGEFGLDTLLAALGNGYNVERTPEEIAAEQRKIAEYRIAQACAAARREPISYAHPYVDGARSALRILSDAGYGNIPRVNAMGEVIQISTEVSE